jgi:hypothetical protein
MPKCPRPPIPRMATTSPTQASLFQRALYVVTPAHIRGAASVYESSLGISVRATVGATI